MIETHGLTRRFGDLVAVDALDLSVAKGEVLGFLGPNGAGKTTTVRMLTGLIAPTAGTARVAGCDVRTQAAQVRRQVGLLTETPGMYERLSASRNLRFYGELYGVDDPDRQAEKYLRLLDLWDRRDDPVGSYSKGMRQRLALCRALLHEPRIVFLDEPTSALDPEAARNVREFIAALRSEGRTIFLCTHNLDEADRLCDRIAVFKGRLLALDSPAALRAALFGAEVVVRMRTATDAHLAAAREAAPGAEVALADGRLLLRGDDSDARVPAVVRALVHAGADILSVESVRRPLEQVYLELVGSQ